MTLLAAVGKAQSLNATEAASLATDQALNQIGRHPIVLAIIAAPHDYPVKQVVDGVAGLLSDTILIGFSTPAQLTHEGMHQRSIAVALIAGDQVQASASCWERSDGSRLTGTLQASKIMQSKKSVQKALLVIADGLNGDASEIPYSIPSGNFKLGGCLTGGDPDHAHSFQIGGSQFSHTGIAEVMLGGELNVGIGSNHGWQPIGVFMRISQSKELRLQTLDGRRASEAYSRLFGYPARDWNYPPLNHLVRLYPLGLENEDFESNHQISYLVRSPVGIESDGSFRMNPGVPQGKTAHILVSSVDNCIAAAKLAARQALEDLGQAKPVLGLVFADIAWQMMMQAQPGSEVDAIRDVLGYDLPIIGGYSLGQFSRSPSGNPELLNQHLQVVLFGDPYGS
jgi:hypothetical protein